MVGNIPEFQKLKIGHPYEWSYLKLVGGFKYVYFHPYLGKWSNLINIFQMGWNHQLANIVINFLNF